MSDQLYDDASPLPDWQYAYRALLQHNYLPARSWYRDEIPPCFSTGLLTPEIANALIENTNASRRHDTIRYRLARHVNSTRLLAVPHPAPYARLCQTITGRWDTVMSLIGENVESRIVPRMYDDDIMISFGSYESGDEVTEDSSRLIIQRHPPSLRRSVAERVELAIGKRYLATADIAAFFPSVYTHAIPWAVHGKAAAKADRSDSLYANVIDRHSRHLQRGETIGIPVGPGTSHLLSELLLHPIDHYLRQQGYTFVRFIDDYQCYCDSRRQADAFIIDLETQLAEYSLQLNSSKTSITSLPSTRDDPWVIQLGTQLAEMEISSLSSLSSFFDLAIGLQARWPGSNVVKYAARALARKSEQGEQLDRCARHLLEIAFHHPSVVPILADVAQRCHKVERGEIERLLDRQLQERMPSDAVSWALFTWRQLAGPWHELPSNLVAGIIKTGDCMAIVTLWAIGQAHERIIDFVNGLEAKKMEWGYDRYWLLIHEVGNAAQETRKYRHETGLKLLTENEVTFINQSVLSTTEFEPM